MPNVIRIISAAIAGCILLPALVLAADTDRKEASAATRANQAKVRGELPFSNTEDFELASRGLIAKPDSLEVKDAEGNIIWSMDQFRFVQGDAPDTVNPSLWRQAKLNSEYGLYKVSDRIYQVRGYDISNLSVIEGETGYIVVDPLLSREVAAAAMELVYQHLGKKPVKAVIYSHSHADHFGGVKGVVSEDDVKQGKVRIIASEGFMKHTVSENVLAGNAMTRRVTYMFGTLLPRDTQGMVDDGLGKAIATGVITLIPPTDIITETGQELVIDGVRMVFMNTPFAEAPAELMFDLPDLNAFYAAEEANGTLHNLYTLRGAQVRDALLWGGYLHEAADRIDLDTEVIFGGHSWPRWGYENIVTYLRKQGDAYRYIHDQTLRLANHGYTMNEIPQHIQMPDELAHVWYNRGYYGTVSHNSRAVYNKYLGYFDGNPAHMDPLPPDQAASRYVEFMGGPDQVLKKATEAFESGDYRWVVEVVNHLVFADPDNMQARSLQANALEQLGYQSESGQWRNFYLTGARELRNGVLEGAAYRTISNDMVSAISLDMFFDYMAVRLNGPKAAGKVLDLDFHFTDSDEHHSLNISNGVLHHRQGTPTAEPDVSIELTRNAFIALTMLGTSPDQLVQAGAISVTGNESVLTELLSMLDEFEFWFNIVTP